MNTLRLCSGPCPQRGAIASARPFLTLPFYSRVTTFAALTCFYTHYLINWKKLHNTAYFEVSYQWFYYSTARNSLWAKCAAFFTVTSSC